MKVSFIIPVFNTESYLRKCIQSCLDQDLPKDQYEIICINDGSTDESLLLLKQISKEEENVIVLDQPNKKQGAARNNGLMKAKGEYIWFIDSDDWIERNILKDLLKFSVKNTPDVIRFDAVDYFSGDKTIPRKNTHIPEKVYRNNEVFIEDRFSVCTPFHLFKREFLSKNNLVFVENIFYEDSEFMLRVFEKVRIFQYYPQNLYNVRKREESTTRTVNHSRKLDILSVIRNHLNYLKENTLDQRVENVFHKHITINMNTLLMELAPSRSYFKIAANELRSLKDLKLSVKRSGSILHNTEYKMLRHPFILRTLLNFYYQRNLRKEKFLI